MNGDLLFTVCEDGAELPDGERDNLMEAGLAATHHKRENPDAVVTLLVNLKEVQLQLEPGDVGKIADALDMLAGLDEGENTDYEELVRLRDLVRGQAVLR